jgi:hypothetical protein
MSRENDKLKYEIERKDQKITELMEEKDDRG